MKYTILILHNFGISKKVRTRSRAMSFSAQVVEKNNKGLAQKKKCDDRYRPTSYFIVFHIFN